MLDLSITEVTFMSSKNHFQCCQTKGLQFQLGNPKNSLVVHPHLFGPPWPPRHCWPSRLPPTPAKLNVRHSAYKGWWVEFKDGIFFYSVNLVLAQFLNGADRRGLQARLSWSHSHYREKVQFFETRLRIIFLALTWRDGMEIIIWPFSYFETRTIFHIVILMLSEKKWSCEQWLSTLIRMHSAA